MSVIIKGQIYSVIGGLYRVETEKGSYNCRPRGVFRNQGITPYVGDYVKIDPAEEMSGTIVEIEDRKNFMVRPAVTNIDYMVVVASTISPVPNLLVLDKFLASIQSHSIPCVIAVTKPDLASPEEIADLYKGVGYDVYIINNETRKGTRELEAALGESLCVFAGNTGTGKSSLLNALDPSFNIKVGETSKKLGRGRHTTRHVEIFTLDSGLRIVDTPGFSTIDVMLIGDLDRDSLAYNFVDFSDHIPNCKFRDCSHITEIGCAVLKAVKNGEIMQSRYNSYVQIYNEIKDVKDWDRN